MLLLLINSQNAFFLKAWLLKQLSFFSVLYLVTTASMFNRHLTIYLASYNLYSQVPCQLKLDTATQRQLINALQMDIRYNNLYSQLCNKNNFQMLHNSTSAYFHSFLSLSYLFLLVSQCPSSSVSLHSCLDSLNSLLRQKVAARFFQYVFNCLTSSVNYQDVIRKLIFFLFVSSC